MAVPPADSRTLVLGVLAAPSAYEGPTRHVLEPVQGFVHLGRMPDCVIQLGEATVSRRHAEVRWDGERWTIRDLGSRLGTLLDGVPLAGGTPVPLQEGDLVQIGPFVLRVRLGGVRTLDQPTIADDHRRGASVRVVDPGELGGLAQERLRSLIDATQRLSDARTTGELAQRTAQVVADATGAPRVLMVRISPGAEEIEMLGRVVAGTDGHDPGHQPTVSRTLLRLAARGELAQVVEDQPISAAAHSIDSLGIRSAICVPIMLGGAPEAFLYLDARQHERRLPADAAGFCQAIAQISGLALANLRRADLEQRQRRITEDLAAARDAQQALMPGPSGIVGVARYVLAARPGRYVAGDLMDVFALPGDRTAVLLGDVVGKGVAAAVRMSAVQTCLRLHLESGRDPAAALAETGRFVSERFGHGSFVTCWLGVLDRAGGVVRYADGGHGLAFRLGPDGTILATLDEGGGMPLGVEADESYAMAETPLGPDDRLLVVSDGAVEQIDAGDVAFGTTGLARALEDSRTPETDVGRLTEAVLGHAGPAGLADDLTIVSAAWAAPDPTA